MKRYKFKNRIWCERTLREFFSEDDIKEMAKIGLLEEMKEEKSKIGNNLNTVLMTLDDIFSLPEVRIYLTDKVIEG